MDYYLDQSDVEAEFEVSINLRECIHKINNARATLKVVVMNATELRSQFEVDLAIVVVEHKSPELRSGETFMECDKDALVQKEIKSREKRRTVKRSWQKLGCQIWGHLKPHTLQKIKLTAVEIPGEDIDSWSRIDEHNKLKNSSSITTLKNSRTQVTHHLDIRHWTKSLDTHVAHL
jgi:hypothetical protein